eukprot:c5803_g1_i1.p1 GENE.c5803_g1_i1~~c5803_g1_i1.p1  ORF type:complete len:649 (+),score=127.96 c5803_g1_i1:255-1949(+)
MEILHFARALKRPIFAAFAQANYVPTSALGAMSAAAQFSIVVELDSSALGSAVGDLEKAALNLEAPKTGDFPNSSDFSRLERIGLNRPESKYDLYISHDPDTEHIAAMLAQAAQDLGTVRVEKSSEASVEEVSSSKVFIPIYSPEYTANISSRHTVEQARALGIKTVPVIGIDKYNPTGWASLAIAGVLYHVLVSEEQARTKFFDSFPLNDFVYACKSALHPPASEEEKEISLVESLNKRVEECKIKLATWPPAARPKASQAEIDLYPTIEIKGTEITMEHINYTVSRLDFAPPKPLFDQQGVPLRHTFDVMFSYEWKSQDLVRQAFMDFRMKNLDGWMDIWGGMVGNINESMALAVESSLVMLVFLTNAYQASPNCRMELKYAIARKRPIVLINADPNLVIAPWISEALPRSPMFEVRSVDDFAIIENGLPRINFIANAVRGLGDAFRKNPLSNDSENDVSEEVHRLRELLEDALCAIDAAQGTSRFQKCSRCGVDYEEAVNNADSCKKHSAYFMGGTLLAPRWVCCSQNEQNSPGCSKAPHTSEPRAWTLDENYGTYSYLPA